MPLYNPVATGSGTVLSVEEYYRGSTGTIASTFDRGIGIETNATPLSTGRISVVRILLPKSYSVTNLTFWSMTTALNTGTNQWFGLFDSARNKLALTADDTNTAWAANTAKTLAITGGPYVTTTAGWYYLGIMVKGTTPPSLAGTSSSGNANFHGAAPLVGGSADSSLTNPASCPSQLASLSNTLSTLLYAEVS